ncbi:TraX family protein [Clostridium sp. AN503]|uniref:TraX family protein n=1 Tax=Clostridium sp. AN503 TaxID=3160598 RepID=UPI00345A2D57
MTLSLNGRLNGNQLKLIAVISMLVDHIGYLLVGDGVILPMMMRLGKPMGGWWILYCVLRMIGRVAFPIFCFLLLEGFLHTRDWRRYALRLGVFAVVSEIPFDLMGAHVPMSWDVQNVFFTLFLGLLMMKALETVGAVDLWKPGSAQMPLKTLLQLAVILLFCGAAWLLKTDYGYIGIMLIALLYWFRWDRTRMCVMGFVWMVMTMRTLYMIPGLALGFFLIYLYNGQRGKWKGKYLFYLFYPAHMLALAGIYHLIFV